jgi:hypothetical protein
MALPVGGGGGGGADAVTPAIDLELVTGEPWGAEVLAQTGGVIEATAINAGPKPNWGLTYTSLSGRSQNGTLSGKAHAQSRTFAANEAGTYAVTLHDGTGVIATNTVVVLPMASGLVMSVLSQQEGFLYGDASGLLDDVDAVIGLEYFRSSTGPATLGPTGAPSPSLFGFQVRKSSGVGMLTVFTQALASKALVQVHYRTTDPNSGLSGTIVRVVLPRQ